MRSKTAFTVKELLSELGLSRTKLYRELSEGKISARKIGRKTVFLADEVARYVSSLPLLK